MKTQTLMAVLCFVLSGGCVHQCAPTIETVHQCDQTYKTVHKGLNDLDAMTKNPDYSVMVCLDILEKVEIIQKTTARESACYDWTETNANLLEIKKSMLNITMCVVLREHQKLAGYEH